MIRHRTRIVLAEGHRIVREGMRRLLEDGNGFRVVGEAADGIEALRLVTELRPGLLVTDMRMPGMNGVELIRRVKVSSPDMKVIVLSMYSTEAYVYSALAAGADGYVFKHAGIQNLNTAIQEVLHGQLYLSPPMTRQSLETYIIKNDKAPLPS